MTDEFKTAFEALLAELTGDLRYHNPATGENIAPQIVETMPPPPEVATDLDGEYPLLCWTIYDIELGNKPSPMKVLIDFGVKVDEESGTLLEQISRGSAQLKEFATALAGLKANRWLANFQLQLPMSARLGDQSPGFEGAQPLPYHHGRIYLSFLPKYPV